MFGTRWSSGSVQCSEWNWVRLVWPECRINQTAFVSLLNQPKSSILVPWRYPAVTRRWSPANRNSRLTAAKWTKPFLLCCQAAGRPVCESSSNLKNQFAISSSPVRFSSRSKLWDKQWPLSHPPKPAERLRWSIFVDENRRATIYAERKRKSQQSSRNLMNSLIESARWRCKPNSYLFYCNSTAFFTSQTATHLAIRPTSTETEIGLEARRCTMLKPSCKPNSLQPHRRPVSRRHRHSVISRRSNVTFSVTKRPAAKTRLALDVIQTPASASAR